MSDEPVYYAKKGTPNMVLNPPIYLVRGIPGAGKSTFAKKLRDRIRERCNFTPGIFETDNFFVDPINGDYKFDSGLTETAHNWNIGEVYKFCRDFYCAPCIVANSFTTEKEIRPYRNIARSLGRLYYIIDLYTEHESVHNVPENVIKAMKTRWQETNSNYRVYEDSEMDTVVDEIANRFLEFIKRHDK